MTGVVFTEKKLGIGEGKREGAIVRTDLEVQKLHGDWGQIKAKIQALQKAPCIPCETDESHLYGRIS